MRVIITGGTGLIGTDLAEVLVQDGYEVVLLSRNPSKHTPPAGSKIVQWDAKTADNWGHLANGAKAIINLAGAGIADGRWTEERRKLIIDSRVNAGNAVNEAVAQAEQKPEMIFQASGVGYYGTHTDKLFTETDGAGNDFPARVTQQWEPATADAEAMGLRRVVGRIGVVLSNDGGAFPKMVLPFRLFAGGPIGSGKQWLSWIHIADLVAAIRHFITDETTSGVYNLCTDNPVTNKEFGKTIGQVMSRPAFAPAPAFVMKLLFGEMSTLLLDGQRVDPARLKQTDFQFQYPTARAVLEALLS